MISSRSIDGDSAVDNCGWSPSRRVRSQGGQQRKRRSPFGVLTNRLTSRPQSGESVKRAGWGGSPQRSEAGQKSEAGLQHELLSPLQHELLSPLSTGSPARIRCNALFEGEQASSPLRETPRGIPTLQSLARDSPTRSVHLTSAASAASSPISIQQAVMQQYMVPVDVHAAADAEKRVQQLQAMLVQQQTNFHQALAEEVAARVALQTYICSLLFPTIHHLGVHPGLSCSICQVS